VVVYDSLDSADMLSVQSKVSTRSGRGIPINTRGTQYLMQLQQFLNEFAFHDNDSVFNCLKLDPKLILRKATYSSCPQQINGYDCSLFGVATLLHLARGIPIDHDIFTQDDVSKFRNGLYSIFSSNITPDPKKLLSPDFVSLFFPLLEGKGDGLGKDAHYDSHLQYYRNSQNELLTLGFSSVPTTPLKESDRNVLSLSKRNIEEELKQYDYIFSGDFKDFKVSSSKS
jgi:Ulp1 protease family, C-terminal catalytic domain